MRGLIQATAGAFVAAYLIGAASPPLLCAVAAPPAPAGLQQVVPPATPSQGATAARPAAESAPSEATLGVQVYPGAQFLTSYDAGRGQRFYLYGVTASFTDVIAYYKVVLKQKGELVFDEPGVYVFEVGRFREDTMAFPPGITIKDYAGAGSKGYLNPKPGAQPSRFPTVLQIVPVPPSSPGVPQI